LIPNDGQRYHHGEAIATGFVASTVNQVVSKRCCKKQQMQWAKPGAHVLLQTRVKTHDGELGTIVKRWYQDMDLEVEEMPAAASSLASPCSPEGLPCEWISALDHLQTVLTRAKKRASIAMGTAQEDSSRQGERL
jgi:hypothetical protein